MTYGVLTCTITTALVLLEPLWAPRMPLDVR